MPRAYDVEDQPPVQEGENEVEKWLKVAEDAILAAKELMVLTPGRDAPPEHKVAAARAWADIARAANERCMAGFYAHQVRGSRVF